MFLFVTFLVILVINSLCMYREVSTVENSRDIPHFSRDEDVRNAWTNHRCYRIISRKQRNLIDGRTTLSKAVPSTLKIISRIS